MESTQQPNPVTGKEGAEIDLQTAARWTRNYRLREPHETISHLFGEDILQRILHQEGCMGIRIYYANRVSLNLWQRLIVAVSNFLLDAVHAKGEKHLILAGVTKDGKDQLPSDRVLKPAVPKTGQEAETAELFIATSNTAQGKYILGEQAMPCPGSPGCPVNALTGGR